VPYVICPRCGMHTFNASYWATVARCARCGSDLPSPRTTRDTVRAGSRQSQPQPTEPVDTALRARRALAGGSRGSRGSGRLGRFVPRSL
jgi:ribosomal protein L37E